MYKIFRNMLTIATIMLCTITCVSANSEYSVIDGMITNYAGNAEVVTVPSVIDGIEIIGIDPDAFQNKDMHTVIIEEGIEVIRPKAFVGCKNLQYVKSPESMLLINEYAFFECNLWLEIDAGQKTHVMDEAVFATPLETESGIYTMDTTGGTSTGGSTTGGEEVCAFLYSEDTITGYIGTDTDVIIPDSIDGVTITTIGDSAFEGNTSITSVIIPDTVTAIGNYAFKGCTALSEVSLPKNLSVAGVETFMNCTSLKSVTIPGSLKNIPTKMFYICTSLAEVVLEEGIEKTGEYAFCECGELKTVSVPSTLKRVDTWSFGNCLKLESFTLPNGVTVISASAFYRCLALTEMIMPDTITGIGNHALRGCSKIVNIKLSENMSRIPYRSLNGCGFSQIKIPESVIYIDDEAFYQCQRLTSIEIPDGVTSIGNSVFYGCFRMTECVIYSEDVTFGTGAFLYVADGCKIWVPENSDTMQSAEEKGITYSVIKDTASVVEQNVYINGELASDGTAIKSGDTISVKYRLITADDTDNDLFFAFLRFDKDGKFLGVGTADAEITKNSPKRIEENFVVTDEEQVKIILFDSIQGIKPLCGANGFISE